VVAPLVLALLKTKTLKISLFGGVKGCFLVFRIKWVAI